MFCIFLSGVLWGTIGIFVKELNSLGADSSLIIFMRMFSALILILIPALIKNHGKIFINDKRVILSCALLGIVSQGIFNICYTASIKLNGMGFACVLMYTAPFFTALASGLIFHEKFSRLKIFALTFNILGCILTVTGGNITGSAISLTGIIAGLGSGFCYGMAAIFPKLAGEKTDVFIVSLYGYFFSILFLLIFRTPDISSAFSDLRISGVGFLYGLIPTSLAYVLYYKGLKIIKDTSKVPVIASVEPVTAVLIGRLLYNEQMNAANFIGFAVVLFSIAIMIKDKK